MLQKIQKGFDDGLDQVGFEGSGRRRVGILESAEGNWGREFYGGVEVVLFEGSVDVFDGGYEEVGCVIGVYEDFISDGNGFDLGFGVVVGDVGLDPLVGERLVVCGGGEELVG